ncbi:uncharacterized protein LTR77_006861 [Saxophila tyrrhenica]|uniref:Major facilitator superfamily (MFS) profile domain-containing protein n=1 Tax=Saxophila tyrrhenica TaxID=1690608 RepID=A0AAV9P609_9PEZI|nr:hypothetical protein LTR77_006861 [Saxophila tyrrhenica]
MDEKNTTAHHEGHHPDKQEIELEHAHQRSTIPEDIPVREALENHLDDDPKLLRRVKRKVDLRLTLVLALLYTCAFIDRSNLGNASIAGMSDDLNLDVGNRYSIVAMIFFVGYALVDVPSTPLMKKIGASFMVPTVCLCFGVLTIAQGFIHSWGALAALRVMLGVFEGALLPATLFLLQVWYTRFEFHKRQAAYYLVGIASSGLSGLLAYGIEKMDGTAGIAGWRWIFIIEGIASSAIAVGAYFVLVDLPEDATKRNLLRMPAFLSKQEAAVLIAHIERDRGDASTENFGLKDMIHNLKDWKVWEFASYVMFNNTALYAFSFFLPIILRDGFGYSYSRANLLTFPPYAVSLVWMAAVSWFCDYYRTRGPVMVFNSCMYLTGLSIVGFADDLDTRYAGVFLGVLGITGNVPTQFAYQHSNTVGQSKRAMTTALMTIGGAFGGIISGNIFREQDAPTYVPGIAICMSFQVITIFLVCKNFIVYSWCNRKADRGEMVIQGEPSFRYTL